MMVYAVTVGRLYYAGERDGQPVWVDERDECHVFETYEEAEALRRKWTRTRSKKAHPFADIINVIFFPADWIQSPV